MEELLYTRLSGEVSFPVAWGTMGEGTTLPRASIYRTGGLRDMHLQGTGLMESRVQVDCYGATYSEAITASRGVRTALEGYSIGAIQAIFLEATRDGFADDAQLLQRVSLTFIVWHND